MYYLKKFYSKDELTQAIENYIHFYNTKRYLFRLHCMTPMEYHTAFAAAVFGAPYAVAVGALGDILGAILFPIGPYFPGFTFTNTLTALCTALFIYKNATILKISISVIINKIIGSLVLNTIWISLLYRGGINAFGAVFITRLPQAGIMTVIEILTLTFLFSNKSKIRTSLKNML